MKKQINKVKNVITADVARYIAANPTLKEFQPPPGNDLNHILAYIENSAKHGNDVLFTSRDRVSLEVRRQLKELGFNWKYRPYMMDIEINWKTTQN